MDEEWESCLWDEIGELVGWGIVEADIEIEDVK